MGGDSGVPQSQRGEVGDWRYSSGWREKVERVRRRRRRRWREGRRGRERRERRREGMREIKRFDEAI